MNSREFYESLRKTVVAVNEQTPVFLASARREGGFGYFPNMNNLHLTELNLIKSGTYDSLVFYGDGRGTSVSTLQSFDIPHTQVLPKLQEYHSRSPAGQHITGIVLMKIPQEQRRNS